MIGDDDLPRRRRGANAIAAEADAERNFAVRFLLQSPKDLIAGALAFAAVSAVVANALFLQAGPHPSPMFGAAVASPTALVAPANPLPRARPVEASIKPADVAPSDARPAEPRSLESRNIEPKSVESRSTDSKGADSRSADPMTNLVKATSAAPAPASSIPRPPASVPATTLASSGSRRVAAVQRALTEYGYGQLKPTGTIGADTQAAIQKFERARKIPVTGQMSDRLVRELVAMIGHPID